MWRRPCPACHGGRLDTRLLPPTGDGLAVAGELLRAGRLVAFPTETVYGLGADATTPAAVAGIFAAKQRPADNPLIVHLAAAERMGEVASEVTPLAERLAAAFWPGPLTLVLDARPELPRETTGGLDTVAVRVPDHPVAITLLQVAAVPVAAPSANRSGRPSPTTAGHVLADLGGAIDAVVDGGSCPLGVESTVVDARGEVAVVLREGGVTREDLEQTGTSVAAEGEEAASPGTRHRHYQPSCRVQLAAPGRAAEEAAALAIAGEHVALLAREPAPDGVVEAGRFDDAGELAPMLYGALRDAELAGVDVVVVETVAEEGIGRAVMDRLRRAAD
ncbi:MAG: L-threonylcarbamoyladenylate synthase [Trueperaceae bacterium]|nr:L-threonylcarbamoyladenylate synthase [Trueperaceae bacterium]